MTTPAWCVEATDALTGEPVTWWVAAGLLADRPVADADALPGRWLLPGLVDAHCHLTLLGAAEGPRPAPPEHVTALLRQLIDLGVLAVRDTGAHDDTAVRLAVGDGDGVRVVACGRFLAPPRGYFPGVFTGVTGDELPAAGVAELDAGAAWVKLVADFPAGADPSLPPEPNYDVADVARFVDAVHTRGGRVAAHVTTALVRSLVEAGIDSVEHGTALDADTVRLMADRGTAWTPTLCAVTALPPDASDERRARVAERSALMRELLPEAVRRGVAVMAGSDVVGSVAEEVAKLVEHGVAPADALRSATSTAREFLGLPPVAAGQRADLVTYDADPREHPEVLAQPAAVVCRGVRVA